MATISGTTTNDTIKGTNSNDTISGGDGNDVIKAGAGDDVVYGGDGNDIIEGGQGADTLYGGTGTDTVLGGQGNDTLVYDMANNTVIFNADVDSAARSYYDGSQGIDTLILNLTSGQLQSAAFQADLVAFQAYVNARALNNGAADTGFSFQSIPLDVHSIEAFSIHLVNTAPSDIELDNSSVDENAAGAVIGQLSVVDNDFSDTHTWTVSDERFEIVNDMLMLKEGVSLNHEATPTIDITLSATDLAGGTTSKVFTINVSDINEGPTAMTLNNAVTGITENATGLVLGNITVNDPDHADSGFADYNFSVSDNRFVVDANGVLKMADGVSFDYETEHSVTVDVTASDGTPGGYSITQQFTFNINDVNVVLFDNGDNVVDFNNINQNAANEIVNLYDAQGGNDSVILPNAEQAALLNFDYFNVFNAGDGNDNISLSYTNTTNAAIIGGGGFDSLFLSGTSNPAGDIIINNDVDISQKHVLIQNISDMNTMRVDYNDFDAISLNGGMGDDTILGGFRIGDTIIGGRGNDDIDGRDGNDTAVYLGSRNDYQFNYNASTFTLTITDTVADRDGIDTLHRVEFFKFNDGTLSFADLNQAPTAINYVGADSITENATNVILGTMSVSDPDSADSGFATYNYTVSDNRFVIDANGLLKTANGVSFDYETQHSVTFDVTASDGILGGHSINQQFSFNINNVNDTGLVIFDDNDNNVDFSRDANLYADKQIDNLYNALGGRDTIRLPDVDAATKIGYDYSQTFNAGAGNDEVVFLYNNVTTHIDGGDGFDRLILGGSSNETGDIMTVHNEDPANSYVTINAEMHVYYDNFENLGLSGAIGNDILIGSNASGEMFNGGAGNDSINGNGGDDSAIYTFDATLSQYLFSYDATTLTLTVTDTVAGRDGSDHLQNIEHLFIGGSTYDTSTIIASLNPLQSAGPTQLSLSSSTSTETTGTITQPSGTEPTAVSLIQPVSTDPAPTTIDGGGISVDIANLIIEPTNLQNVA